MARRPERGNLDPPQPHARNARWCSLAHKRPARGDADQQRDAAVCEAVGAAPAQSCSKPCGPASAAPPKQQPPAHNRPLALGVGWRLRGHAASDPGAAIMYGRDVLPRLQREPRRRPGWRPLPDLPRASTISRGYAGARSSRRDRRSAQHPGQQARPPDLAGEVARGPPITRPDRQGLHRRKRAGQRGGRRPSDALLRRLPRHARLVERRPPTWRASQSRTSRTTSRDRNPSR
jgi:hypothetical protein